MFSIITINTTIATVWQFLKKKLTAHSEGTLNKKNEKYQGYKNWVSLFHF